VVDALCGGFIHFLFESQLIVNAQSHMTTCSVVNVVDEFISFLFCSLINNYMFCLCVFVSVRVKVIDSTKVVFRGLVMESI